MQGIATLFEIFHATSIFQSPDLAPVVVRGPPPGLVPVQRASAGAGPGAPVPARRILHAAFLQGAPQTVS